MTRQKILITGASSGLGAGMARAFAAKGRDLALCARRTDRLDELKAELAQRYPDVKVAVAALDVNDHDQVPKVFAELSDALGGIDRVIVNAGIGKGAPLGSGKLWANKATIETNLVAALVQIETAVEMLSAPALATDIESSAPSKDAALFAGSFVRAPGCPRVTPPE